MLKQFLLGIFYDFSVRLKGDVLVYRYQGKDSKPHTKLIPVHKITKVEYQWDMAVGLQATWNFVDAGGETTSISAGVPGIKDVLAQLRELLPKFPDISRKTLVDDELAWDCVNVWERDKDVQASPNV